MHLPSDIATEILSRLPVESIIRFRSVSKTWLNFIENPRFASLQYCRSASNADLTPTFIFFNNFCNQAYIIEAENPESFKSTKLNLGFPCQGTAMISCSVNGILAISAMSTHIISTYITNPAVRQDFVKLPDINIRSYRNSGYSIGFGYDRSTDMYKVIIVLLHNDGTSYEVQIITLGSNSWRIVETAPTTPYSYITDRSGVVSGNSIHWRTKQYILTFDLRSESLGSLPYPQFDYYDDRRGLKILDLKGNLSLASYPYFNDRILLCIRKNESWSKHIIYKGFYGNRCNIRLISFYKDRELLMLKDLNSLLSYNMDTGKYTQIHELPVQRKTSIHAKTMKSNPMLQTFCHLKQSPSE